MDKKDRIQSLHYTIKVFLVLALLSFVLMTSCSAQNITPPLQNGGHKSAEQPKANGNNVNIDHAEAQLVGYANGEHRNQQFDSVSAKRLFMIFSTMKAPASMSGVSWMPYLKIEFAFNDKQVRQILVGGRYWSEGEIVKEWTKDGFDNYSQFMKLYCPPLAP